MLRYYPKRTGSAFTSANTEIWNYNAKGEVVTANHSSNAFDRSFEFDGIGNRKKSAEGLDLTAPTVMSYNANALNQYSQITNAQISNRLHDADGNLTDDGAKFFVWDAENCLIEIKLKSDDSAVATYAYDYQSRRITKTVGSTVTNFVYDGWNPIAEYTSALSPLSFTLSTSYTWGMDLSGSMQGAGGVGGLLSVNDGSATYYPIYDGNGNVSEYVDATGAVVAHYEYDAFGQVVASGTKADEFTHQFSTKQLDSESGLHYYGYRYYDSANGRWLGRDPVMELGGENLYGVAINDTLNQIDYLGLSPLGPVVIPNRKGSNCAGTAVFPRHVLNNGGQAQYVPSPQNMTNPSGEENEDKTPGAGCRKVSGSSDCKTKKPDCERHVIVYIPLLDAWGQGSDPNYHVIGQGVCGGSYLHQTGANSDVRGPVPDPRAAAEEYYKQINETRPPIETHYCCPNDQ